MLPAKNKKNQSKPAVERRTVGAIVAVMAVLLLGAGLAWWSWTATPQLAASEEVYASVDALFTAVTARREALVADCENKLAGLHREGKIPEPAWKKLVQVIASTRAGQWESAAKDLYRFIERQKRTT